jgi:hypothetical protein
MTPITYTAAAVWVERYETLRRYVLNGPALSSEPLTLALWLGHGMAGWMHNWKMAIENASRDPTLLPRCRATTGWQEQLTHLLAQMTTQFLQA